MRHFRCRCGKQTAFGSDSPPPCDGCPECNTTLESHPDHHRTPERHNWNLGEWEIDAKTGERWKQQRCQNGYCRATRRFPTALDGMTERQVRDMVVAALGDSYTNVTDDLSSDRPLYPGVLRSAAYCIERHFPFEAAYLLLLAESVTPPAGCAHDSNQEKGNG